jgi:hypothetical protein
MGADCSRITMFAHISNCLSKLLFVDARFPDMASNDDPMTGFLVVTGHSFAMPQIDRRFTTFDSYEAVKVHYISICLVPGVRLELT